MQTAAPAPVALPVTVDTTGAKILEGSPAERDSRDIYLPNHVESVSHIAIDVSMNCKAPSVLTVSYRLVDHSPKWCISQELQDQMPHLRPHQMLLLTSRVPGHVRLSLQTRSRILLPHRLAECIQENLQAILLYKRVLQHPHQGLQ